MGIYTGNGDDGTTGLFGGGQVPKGCLRICAYGEVDELNAVIGWCAAGAGEELAARLIEEQGRLFCLGAWLATPQDALEAARDRLPAWDDYSTVRLEEEIDRFESELGPLQTFILPGGSEVASRLHVARTVCRRAERTVASLAEDESVLPQQLVYLNRLSDWLFTLARAGNAEAGCPDRAWPEP